MPISVNFELLKPTEHYSDYLPELGADVRGKVQTAQAAELESFKLQTHLSGEMAYLTLVTLGISKFVAEDWDEAIADFSESLGQVKEPVPALTQDAIYFYRGIAYRHKQAYDQSIADYTQVIKLKPDDAGVYYNRGFSYREKQAYDQAITDFTQALKLKPDFVVAYETRGYTYADKKDYDKAIADYNQALKLKPDDADAYNNRGIAYRHKGEQQNAIQDFKQALKLTQDPDTRKYAEQNLKELGVH